MSLIQSARMNGHDPYAYLKDVPTRLPSQRASEIGQLLPHQCGTGLTYASKLGGRSPCISSRVPIASHLTAFPNWYFVNIAVSAVRRCSGPEAEVATRTGSP